MMRQSISPAIVKTRPRFFQTIIPKPGSVVASPVLAAYDPEPDYFFHWYRDSALVMDALWLVRDEISDARRSVRRFRSLQRRSGGVWMAAKWRRPRPQADFVQFLRRNLPSAHGAAIAAETRVNPDGTLDITDWPRPQHDGPALRALTMLRWGLQTDQAAALLRRRSRICSPSCPKALFRNLGRRKRPALLCPARLGGGAGERRGLAASP